MSWLKDMKDMHVQHAVDFGKCKSELRAKLKAFHQNLKLIETRLKEHGKIFESVQRLTDKLPELMDHFKNLVSRLSHKYLHPSKDKHAASSDSSSEASSSESSEEIVQQDHTIEEEAFGEASDKDDDQEEFQDEGQDLPEEKEEESSSVATQELRVREEREGKK